MNAVDSKPRLIVIAGPTGVGKTGIALQLAAVFGGEIISADAMQVYRLMDIGTAKPNMHQRSLVRHHLLDVVAPDEPFNAALFVQWAQPVIEDLHRRQKPIFVVGGTGLYIKALLGGLLAGPEADPGLRKTYREELSQYGRAYLYEKLKNRDEQSARRIHPNDTVRIIRALEVIEISGQSIVEQQKRHGFREKRYDCLKIGLKMARKGLFDRIDGRTDHMMTEGLVEEVRSLLAMGYNESLKSMQSLGYKQIARHLNGVYDLPAAIQRIKRDTRHYAKRQMTWFGSDPEMTWFDPDDRVGIGGIVASFLDNNGHCHTGGTTPPEKEIA